MKAPFSFIVAFLFSMASYAQPVSLAKLIAVPVFLPASSVFPVPGSSINYTQILFEYPADSKAVTYVVRIYEMNGKDSVLFREVKDSSNAVIVDGFSFGKSYNWSYRSLNRKGKVLAKSRIYSFNILPLPGTVRINVVKNDSAQNQQGLISFDNAQIIVDRSGNPVWFLPPAPNKEFVRDDLVRDLRITPAGTTTFLTEKNCYELSFDGRILWKGPKVDSTSPNYIENYHHAFERLPNGNFMVAGNHTVKVNTGDTIVQGRFGVVGEYDRRGKLLWKWDSYTYFSEKDLLYKKGPNGKPDISTHLNAFEYADGGRTIYAGFRDMNRVVKVDWASGKVLASYGSPMPSGDAATGKDFFNKQHDITLLRNGNLAVFNNDSIGVPGVISSVVIFSQVTQPGEQSQIVWEFPCKWDSLTDGKSEKGGSIDELPNGNYLINMGSLHRCIEITPDKRIVWDVVEEYYNTDSAKYLPFRQYRSHYVSSLYPCWFTAIIRTNNSKAVTVEVVNEGTEADNYSVQYRLTDGAWVEAATYENVAPGVKKQCMIPRQPGIPVNEVRVISLANRDFVRTFNVKLK